MNPETRDFLLLHFVVFLWGFTAVLGLLISIPAVEMVFHRVAWASILLVVLVRISPAGFRIGWRDALKVTATGSLIAAHWILFFAAARVSTASVCLAGMATTSLWTSFLEPLFLRRSIRWYEVFLGLLAILGLYIIFRFELDHALGLLLALGSAFLASVFTIINSKFVKVMHHYTITFYEMVGATLSIALFFPFYKNTWAGGHLNLIPTGWDWLYLVALVVVCTVFAYSAGVRVMRNLTPFAVNLTVNLEPVYGIILAVLVFGEKEHMTEGFYLGTAIILFSVLLYPVMNRLRRRNKLTFRFWQ